MGKARVASGSATAGELHYHLGHDPDAQWAKMETHCEGKASDPGRSGRDNRLFVEAVLWIARTGSPRRDLPASFGSWNSVYVRFRDWRDRDVFQRLFEACSDEPDM